MHLWTDGHGYQVIPFKPYAYKKSPHGTFTSMYGDKLERIDSWDANDQDLFESDVPDVTRFLIDQYLDSDIPSTGHTILTMDIEVSMEEGLPDMVKAANPITSIAIHDSTLNEYTVLILDLENVLEYQENTYKGCKVTVRPFLDERNLLEAYLDKYQEISPTIVTGWNIDKFDTPYLYNRIARVMSHHYANRLSPIGKVFYNKYRKRFNIAGVSYLDYIELYKNFTFNELPSHALDFVSKKELGRGKIEYAGSLDDLFKTDIEKFIEYNLVDVELVVEMENKLQFIDLARGICHTGHVAYEDFIYSSKYLEGAVLTFMKRKGIVALNKDPRRFAKMNALDNETGTGFDGAYVKDPIPGRYEWIYDLDLTSLYPSIIMSLNISPETKFSKIEDWDVVEYMKQTNDDAPYDLNNGKTINHGELKEFLDTQKVSISSNGVIYKTDKVGIIPEILNVWFNERKQYQAKMQSYGKSKNDKKFQFYKKRQHVQKILLNSLYGVLGLPVFRFYDIDNAEAVTSVGQEVIKTTAKIANAYYNKELGIKDDHVIYIDTDSIFVSALPLVLHRTPDIDINDDDIMTTEIMKVSGEVEDHINKTYDVMASRLFNITNHRFDIKKEIISKSGFWVTKKRYALKAINENGLPIDEMIVKGLDVVRSSFPKAFKIVMKEVLNMILDDVSEIEISKHVMKFKHDLQSLSYGDTAKISSVKEISKYNRKRSNFSYMKGTPAHVKSALAYIDLLKYYKCKSNAPIKDGDKIKWVYLKNNPLGLTQLGFKDYDDPKQILEFVEEYINYEKMYEREFENKIGDFYKSLKWTAPSEGLLNAQEFFEF